MNPSSQRGRPRLSDIRRPQLLTQSAMDQSKVFKNAGRFGLLQPELVQDLVSHFLPAKDQLALGRSCKWLHSIVQLSSEAWQMLFNPVSPLAPLTRSVLGTNSLPAPLQSGFVACLPIGRLSASLAWVSTSEQSSIRFNDAIHAGPLVASSKRPPTRLSTPPSRPINIEGGYCGNEECCDACGIYVVNNCSLYLPLFLNQDHFDSAFPLLYDQVTCAILDGQSLDNPPPVPYTLVSSFFPQLVRNMAARLALAAHSPTVNDLEVFVQVQALWRATMHRFNRNSMSWITQKIRTHADNLARGGTHARQVPLMELVSLMHVSTAATSAGVEWTWPKIAQMVVQENTIRLFECIRACRGCSGKVFCMGLLPENTLWLANKVAEGRFDGNGFVPWQILLVHARFLRATSLLPTMAPLSSFARMAGQLDCGQHLVPGPLARLLHPHLVQHIRPSNAECASWAGIWRGLGAAPMQHDALTKWLDWCSTQAKLRPGGVLRVGRTNSSYCRPFCPICPLPLWRHPDTRLSSVTFHPTIPCSPEYSPSQVLRPLPTFTFIALNRHGALLYAHGDTFGIRGMGSGFLCLDVKPTPHGSHETTLDLDSLDELVAYVAVATCGASTDSSVYATVPGWRQCWDGLAWQDVRASTKVSRLSWVCARGLDNGGWDLVRATAVPRNGAHVRMWYHENPDEHTWLIAGKGTLSEESARNGDVSIAECVDAAQEWVLEYVKMCQVNGVNSHGVSETESQR